jgi:2-(1,2-epoxy-1,2-dihydrophenyl)acetyl-CoA isomerase
MRLNLVNRVVPLERLEEEVTALATRLSSGPTAAYGRTKALLHGSFGAGLSERLEAERQAFRASTAMADFTEGVAAFIEKRAARFTGA